MSKCDERVKKCYDVPSYFYKYKTKSKIVNFEQVKTLQIFNSKKIKIVFVIIKNYPVHKFLRFYLSLTILDNQRISLYIKVKYLNY